MPEPTAIATAPESGPSVVRRVERLHAIVAAVATLVAVIAAPRPVWSAILAGALVGAGNFRLLAVLTTRLVAGTTQGKHNAIGILLVKFTGLAVVLGAIVLLLQPNAIAFLAALTLAPLCLVAVVLRGRKGLAVPVVEVR